MAFKYGDWVAILESFVCPGGAYLHSGARGVVVRRVLPNPYCDLEIVAFPGAGRVGVRKDNLVLIQVDSDNASAGELIPTWGTLLERVRQEQGGGNHFLKLLHF